MGWVKDAIKELNEKGICKIQPFGGSMRGKIESGDLVTLQRYNDENLETDDAVFVKWKGNYLLHLVKDRTENDVLIGNNLGKINGWISKKDVIGIVIAIEKAN